MKKEQNEHYLKDLIFRGAFFVILIYLLVFLYNHGFFHRLLGPQ